MGYDTDTYDKLIQIIRPIVGTVCLIEPSTNLNTDLHIYGDDAWEILESVHKTFSVVFDGLQFEKYFYTEEEVYLPYFLSALLLKKRKPLPVVHVMRVIERGQWFDPE
jgi:hypothetical protein